MTLASFPQRYVFSDGEWRKRAGNTHGIGRLYAVHPNRGDAFYLRMLLCTLNGADVRLCYENALDILEPSQLCCICNTRRTDRVVSACGGSHTFCHRCLAVHMAQSDARSDTCPLCRGPIGHPLPINRPDEPPVVNVNLLKYCDGEVCTTFKDACEKRGLLQDDGEWHKAMTEAAVYKMPEALRNLFLHILSNCQPTQPDVLFEDHWANMGDDFERDLRELGDEQCTPANIRACTLHCLLESLDPTSSAVDKIAYDMLPQLTDVEKQFVQTIGTRHTQALAHVYNYDMASESNTFDEHFANCKKISAQHDLVQHVIDQVNANQQMLLFVDAPGGCGKTYTENCLLAYFRSQGLYAMAVASTGIAAIQLSGGKTVHTGFKVPIDTSQTSSGPTPLPIHRNSALGKLIIEDLNVIVWDEATMIHRDIFESLEMTLRELRNDPRPFGGVSVLLAGDFRQTMPVVKGATRSVITTTSILHSHIFRNFDEALLGVNVRVEQCRDADPERGALLDEWARSLLLIGNGLCIDRSDDPAEDFVSYLPPIVQTVPVHDSDGVTAMITHTFGDLTDISKSITSHFDDDLPVQELMANDVLRSAILCPKHESVDMINQRCLDMWDGDLFIKHAMDDYTDRDDSMVVTLEQLQAHTPGGSPPARLGLKVGMPLILLRNMGNGLMNGTRMLLVSVQPNVIKCIVTIDGPHQGRIVFLPRFTFKHEGPDQPLSWSRRQFPVKPCWAMTINKSQGQTFAQVAVCLVQAIQADNGTTVIERADAFAHGQLYVALSRCGDPDRVRVYTTSTMYDKGHTINVVYPEALPEGLRIIAGANSSLSNPQLADERDEDVLLVDNPSSVTYGPHCEPFDVPWHGYVYPDPNVDVDGGYVHWDGAVSFSDDVFYNHVDDDPNDYFNSDEIEALMNT